MEILEMNLIDELAHKLDEFGLPGSAVVDFHNISGWMKMRLWAFSKVW